MLTAAPTCLGLAYAKDTLHLLRVHTKPSPGKVNTDTKLYKADTS